MKEEEEQIARAALEEAIEQAGGVRPLARLIGISPQAISKWSICPPARVAAIERVTSVSRDQLRPDWHSQRGGNHE